jgi:hypothetical protein
MVREERGHREKGETRTQAGTPKERGEAHTRERKALSFLLSRINLHK